MAELIDLTGQRFNKLVVLRKSGNDKYRKTIWLCQCDCGNLKEVTRERLMTGQKSCGCIWKDKRIGSLAVEHKILSRYKGNAITRNIKWKLSEQKFYELINSPCHYCGQVDKKLNDNTGEYFFLNGIDRINSSKDYVDGNVVSCCKRCNIAKNDMTYSEFMDWISRVYVHVRQEVPNG